MFACHVCKREPILQTWHANTYWSGLLVEGEMKEMALKHVLFTSRKTSFVLEIFTGDQSQRVSVLMKFPRARLFLSSFKVLWLYDQQICDFFLTIVLLVIMTLQCDTYCTPSPYIVKKIGPYIMRTHTLQRIM